ncbi:HPr kinase/phosphorylase [Caulobacter radicis]|uniref:Serine kinase n=1 Tax=Caulobacter radicis TaxID=2172650 RepID=A0A2T9JE40_9CAUL|nr:HPr kinase/phosphorylase [Caulobacter radicis]PVM81167.1 serine kinase [Caulobacter radicis]
MIRHAGLVARRVGGLWRGVLIEGASGSGKSDLALRALEAGFRLVADDRVVTFVSEGRLYGRAPDPLKGLIEVRGFGIVPEPALPFAEITLLARCVDDPARIERLPQTRTERLLGLDLPAFELWPLEPAAPAKIARMLEHLGVAP